MYQSKDHIYLKIVMDLHDCSYCSICYVVNIQQSFNKSPDTRENLHSQKPESFSESNDTNYFHNSELEINRKSIHEINNANQNVMSTDDNKCSNNCNHEDPSQSSNIYDPLTDTLYLKLHLF
jgi:hypothetical protein